MQYGHILVIVGVILATIAVFAVLLWLARYIARRCRAPQPPMYTSLQDHDVDDELVIVRGGEARPKERK